MPDKYVIETFGCQMNVHDSERIAGLLDARGYERTEEIAAADVIVVNTCSVRERAEDKLYSRLGEIRDEVSAGGRSATIAVTGCVAQQEGAALFERSPVLDVVVGTQAIKELPRLLAEARGTGQTRFDVNPYEDVSFPLGVARHSDPVRALVTIIEGCNEFCSFCVVPYTRGHERMRPAADILADVHEAANTGHVEVQLLGQIVNHYQAPDDPTCDFAALLERVSDVPAIARVRFASPHPRYVSDRLVGAIRDLPKVCKHLHLPVQSGSNRLLQLMRRRYTREEYLDGVDRLRASVAGIDISTDIIVGFPGETEEDFEDTMDLVRRIGYQSIYSFKYSARPNTLAMKRLADDVPEAVKTRRIMTLQAEQRDIQQARHASQVGLVKDVLIDGISRRRSSELTGRTMGYSIVNLPGPSEWLGRLVKVRITAAAPNSLRGEAISAAAASL